MRRTIQFIVLSLFGLGPALAQELPQQDAVRIREFYRLAAVVQDKVWPNWSQTPAPLLLVTEQSEFLTHHANVPKGFTKVSDDVSARPRQFPSNLQATFPAFGPPDVIVVGEPEETESKTSTTWLFTLMHEHFHQLQDAQHGAFESVNKLGLSHGDQTGMWMLNYPFPYDKSDVIAGFVHLRDLLLSALAESDKKKFGVVAQKYVAKRKDFYSHLTADDRKYLKFQLWKEGIARYTQIKSAEAAANYRPTHEYASLPDYESFTSYAGHARQDTLDELRKADIASWKRQVVYSWGAGEGLLLDRLKPGWREEYFANPFTMDEFFQR